MLNRVLYNLILPFLKDYSLGISQINFSPLKGGKSSANLYQFDINALSFVLRIPPENASLLTRAHQSFLAKRAGEIGIGPKVYYIDPEFRGIVLDYISGQEAQVKDFESVFLLDKMAEVLRALHQDTRAFPIADSPFKRFHNFLEKSTFEHTEIKKLKSCMDEIEQTLKFYPLPLCPTHLDLHLSNIILKGRKEIFLIDWVNGGLNDPFFDLSTFSYFSELSETRIERFLTTYFQRVPTEIEKARFNIILPVRIMVIAAAFFSNSSNLNNESKIYIEKSIHLIEGEIFKYSLKELQNRALKQI